MSDNIAYWHYADPENREPAGPGHRRGRTPKSSHVPVRFRPDVIGAVKYFADQDRKTVSAWIRDLVEDELDRRRPRGTHTGSPDWAEDAVAIHLDQGNSETSTAGRVVSA
jgi:hypothetical protein